MLAAPCSRSRIWVRISSSGRRTARLSTTLTVARLGPLSVVLAGGGSAGLAWAGAAAGKIGRAACRGRGEISVGAGSLKKKKKRISAERGTDNVKKGIHRSKESSPARIVVF